MNVRKKVASLPVSEEFALDAPRSPLANAMSKQEKLALLVEASCFSEFILWVTHESPGRWRALEVESGVSVEGSSPREAVTKYWEANSAAQSGDQLALSL